MTAQITWAKGGTARVLSLSKDAIALDSETPSPPGSRIEGELAGGGTVRMKVHGSRKQEDGRYRIEGRALDMTREMRERIEEHLR